MRYAVYEIKQHDDVRKLAQKLLGDLNRWRELVTINRLVYPYIASEVAGPGVLIPGDSLLYPGAPGISAPPSAAADADAETYGRDLALVNGYLVPQGASYAIVTGLENFRGALERRMNTSLGGLPAHPGYGHSAKQYVGRTGGPEDRALAALEFERCAKSDDRTLGVVTRHAYDGARALEVECDVTPVTPGTVLVVRGAA